MSKTRGSLKKVSYCVALIATAAGFLFAANTVSPFPQPLIAQIPLGSLIYSGSTSGKIQNAGDTVSLTLPVNANETITIDVSPDANLQPTVTLTDPNGNLTGAATASGAGHEAILQTVPASVTGTYTIVLSGANNTTGNFTVLVTLNAALDVAAHGGGENSTLATAQDISPSAISLTATADRLAVVGHFEGTPDFYSFHLQSGQSATLVLALTSNAAAGLQLLDSTGNLLAIGASGASNVSQVISNFVAAANGTYFAKVSGNGQSDYSLVVVRSASFDLEPNDNAAQAQDINATHTVLGYIGNGANVPDSDWYSFHVNAGNTITLATTTPSDQGGEFHNGLFPAIELYDNNGNLVASNSGGPKNTSIIYQALTTGTYFARISGANNSSGEYVLFQSAQPLPILSVAKNHTGIFMQGVTAEWDVIVSNGGTSATLGTTTLTDTLPGGYTVNSFSTTDASWSCSGAGTATVTCTNMSAVNGGSSFPVIRVIVNIPANSPTTVTNTAKAFGGGDAVHTNLATAASASDTVSVMQVPASVTPTAGTPQSTPINTAFPAKLQATVRDAGGVGVSNVNVTFQAPGSGPSGTFGPPCGGTICVVTTNGLGVAIAPVFTANGIPGSYSVTATVAGLMPANFALTNVAPPTFTKTIATPFGAGSINQGDTTPITFVVSNSNSIALTGLSFIDLLPTGLLIQNANGLANTCGGSVSAVPGTGTISLTGGTVNAMAICTISVNVTGIAEGNQTNPSVTLTSNEAPSSMSAPASVFVDAWWLSFFY